MILVNPLKTKQYVKWKVVGDIGETLFGEKEGGKENHFSRSLPSWASSPLFYD
jgi:hypothetical protein